MTSETPVPSPAEPESVTTPPPAPAAARRRRPLHRRVRRKALAVAALLGPGLIAANAGNDAGGIATYASAGSQFAYRTLFFMVLVTVGLVVVQEMSARLGAYTGEGLMSLIREQFPLRVATFAVVALVVANVGLIVSEFAGIGAALELWGVSRYVSIPVAAAVIWGVIVFGSYKKAEKVFLALSLVFVTYLIAAAVGRADWPRVVSDTVWPHFVATKDFLFLAVALIGTTITPYMQLYQAAAVADAGIGPDEYPGERIDSVAGSIFANVVSMAIIIATAAAIGGTGALDSASEAAKALRPVAGAGAETLFAVGLLGASALAAAVVPLATAYAIAEAIGAERSTSRRITEAPLFVGLLTVLILIGGAVALAPGNLIKLLLNMQVLNGLVTPIVLVFILILANRRRLLGDAVNGRRFNVVATVTVVAVGLLALAYAFQVGAGWFGLM